MRCLFHCRNTTGLGHLMRGHNIARALRELSPEAEIIFTGNRESAASLLLEFPYVPYLGTNSVAALKPDVIVLDTLFPNWKVSKDVTVVYVMRKIKPATLHKFLEHPLAARTDAVLIPHFQEEFSAELPEWIRQKAFWVGPIVRVPNPQVQQLLRQKYGIERSDFVLTSTAGGGGKTEESMFFFDVVSAIHQSLRTALPNLRHFVVRGPYSQISVSPQEGMTVLEMEPYLNDLIALSTVVVAEGGYNTVHEVRISKVPALFIPSQRKHDHQEERVRKLEDQGLCAVFTGPALEVITDGILRILKSEATLDKMKSSLQKDHFEPGNQIAAQKILEIAESRFASSQV